ncbi:7-deoxyloganetic acid glucosyltransferase-like [Apium graveolens]|uniref:7-deoxyloganetic acid glucosyltransferase-like n=1 Tax=Apium graveolens TaxID=4045 RepID=UPI003D7966CC
MLKLAELLCLADFHVTFLNIDHFHCRLLQHTDIESRFSQYPRFHFETISDGLPKDHPRCADKFYEMMDAMENVVQPLLKEKLKCGSLSSKSSEALPITCIISEAIIEFALNIAQQMDVPLFYFDTIGPCAVWTYLCLPKLIEAGEVPFKDNDMDASIRSVQGMESFLRRRDLPHFCRANDTSDEGIQLALTEARQLPKAQGIILNTFEHLDKAILSQIGTLCPNLYAIGPLHSLYNTKLAASIKFLEPTSTNSLWKEDRSCLTWLNAQPPKSVIYVSIGSQVPMTINQKMELWHGLVNSESRFLWIIRPGSIIGETTEDVELLERYTKEKGCIVSWAPQEEVLAHKAIGGFFTHSGWNSTLESIVEGVPMICWPCYVDQQVISRYTSVVWKIGLDTKDVLDRVMVEKMVREVMILRRNEFLKSAVETAKLAKESASQGGSSWCSLDRLIQDIRLMSLPALKRSRN